MSYLLLGVLIAEFSPAVPDADWPTAEQSHGTLRRVSCGGPGRCRVLEVHGRT